MRRPWCTERMLIPRALEHFRDTPIINHDSYERPQTSSLPDRLWPLSRSSPLLKPRHQVPQTVIQKFDFQHKTMWWSEPQPTRPNPSSFQSFSKTRGTKRITSFPVQSGQGFSHQTGLLKGNHSLHNLILPSFGFLSLCLFCFSLSA